MLELLKKKYRIVKEENKYYIMSHRFLWWSYEDYEYMPDVFYRYQYNTQQEAERQIEKWLGINQPQINIEIVKEY